MKAKKEYIDHHDKDVDGYHMHLHHHGACTYEQEYVLYPNSRRYIAGGQRY